MGFKLLRCNNGGKATINVLFLTSVERAEDSVIDALSRIAEREEEFDVAVMIRGGGSTSDLSCFNSYRLCAYVAQFPLPVLTGTFP